MASRLRNCSIPLVDTACWLTRPARSPKIRSPYTEWKGTMARKKAEQPLAGDHGPWPGDGNTAILVVDDEPEVRRFIWNSLVGAGYLTLEAGDAVEAMAITLTFPGRIALAVIDIMMPAVSGLDFANQLLIERPETKILYISGLGHGIAVEGIRRRLPLAILVKPFTARQLVMRVQDLLAP